MRLVYGSRQKLSGKSVARSASALSNSATGKLGAVQGLGAPEWAPVES